jgi:hypothetical protein
MFSDAKSKKKESEGMQKLKVIFFTSKFYYLQHSAAILHFYLHFSREKL